MNRLLSDVQAFIANRVVAGAVRMFEAKVVIRGELFGEDVV